jgi:hypothetical protein
MLKRSRREEVLLTALTRRSYLSCSTPYMVVARWVSRSRAARWMWAKAAPHSRYECPPLALSATASLGVPFYGVFLMWMLVQVRPIAPMDLQWRMWVASFWIIASPALIILWESAFARISNQMLATGSGQWDGKRLMKVEYYFARLFWVFSLSTAVAVPGGWLLSSSFFSLSTGPLVPHDVFFWLGLVSVTVLGFSFGVGNWGVAKTLAYCWTALDREFRINPFQSFERTGLEKIAGFAYTTGILYSLGAVFLPGVYYILPLVPALPRILGLLIAGVLVFGGLGAFLLPSLWIFRISQSERERVTNTYAAVLGKLNESLLRGVGDEMSADRVGALVALRTLSLQALAPPTILWYGARAFVIFLLPLILTLLPLLK